MSENARNIRQSHKLHHVKKLEIGISNSRGENPKKPLQGDSLSLLLFVIAMMAHSYILIYRKCPVGFKFYKIIVKY